VVESEAQTAAPAAELVDPLLVGADEGLDEGLEDAPEVTEETPEGDDDES
jgi:hypothetical protein